MISLSEKIFRLVNHQRTRQWVDAILPYRLWLIIGLHAVLFALSYAFSFAMLHERIESSPAALFMRTIGLLIALRFIVFAYYDLYRNLWAFVSLADLVNIMRATAISSLLFSLIGMLYEPVRVTQKMALLDMFGCIMLVGGIRFLVRNFRENILEETSTQDREHVLLVGPVERVQSVAKEMQGDPYARFKPRGVIDPHQGNGNALTRVCDLPVFSIDHVMRHTGQFNHLDSAVFCWPNATRRQMDRVVDGLKSLGVPFKTLPAVDDILSGRISIKDIRDVEIHDLLERPPIQINMEQIQRSIHNRVVMVTGGGGSIGSELCRQLAAIKPLLLVVVERAEENLYNLMIELKKDFPDLPLHASISSVNDYPGLVALIKETKVDIIFHAAAYKHVPLMEIAPIESAYNNILGTYNVSRAALAGGVKRFVMISTDKAVNPTNVMGATKRIAEMIVQSSNGCNRTRFMVVRFGNVLGSAGSVIPIFNKQISQGGPVTVTDPEIERFFMTIPEAVQLVLEAGCMGQGGEIFILDMGEPVKILHLAEKLISLSGKRPYDDIDIVFTGIRAGEKMYEELFNVGEDRKATVHPQIMTALSSPVDGEYMGKQIDIISRCVRKRDRETLLATFLEIVPNYEIDPNNKKQRSPTTLKRGSVNPSMACPIRMKEAEA
jgi:FlaA1/EpsC-like NDP-sugar epimerase